MQQERQTAVQFNINSEQMAAIEVPLPPISLQENSPKSCKKHERIRAQQQEALRQAEHLFQTILHRAFRDNGL
jgi:type I restriction enzyme S subunit